MTSESAQPQRRQITVAFIDLAGSTELSSRLDPEDFRNLILAYQEAVGTVIERHHGFIARFLGDGILVYFGYPKARENDAELAVRAGLDVIEAVSALDVAKYQIGDGLGVRIGIMTGSAVVGDIIGEGASQESTALGEMPNIAARLQSEAKPNQMVIGDTTKNIVVGLFEFESLGTPELKGVGRAVEAFQVTGVTEATSRFDRSLYLGLSELVGRRRELEELEQAWEKAVDKVQAVAVIADAGIGKSRLVHEFTESLGRDQAFFLLGHCVIGGETSALHPFIELVRTAFQISDSNEDPDEKMKRGLEILGLSTDHLPYLLNLLGRPPESVREVPSELLGTRTLQSLKELLLARCSRSRVVLVIEDLHWCDQLSRELVTWILTQDSLPGLLVLLTYRPEFKPSWRDFDSVQSMELTPLSPHSTGDLLRLRLGDSIPEEIVQQVTVKAEGNPLFAEEMANYLMRSDQQVVSIEGLPANLESLLLDRIDRLETDTRSLLQAASVIGRQFTTDTLERISGLNGQIAPGLNILQQQDLVFPEPGESKFRFKHALVRDAVYHNLLRSDREALHLRLAQSLEAGYADRLEEVVDELADHYEHTDQTEKSIKFLALAGEKSLALYSLDAAQTRFHRVLELMREHQHCSDSALLGRLLLKLARVYYFQYEFKKLINLVDEYLPAIEALGDQRILSRFLTETGYAHVFQGRQDVGKPLLERAFQIAEANHDEEGIGYASMGLMWHYCYWEYPDQACKDQLDSYGNRAIEIGRKIDDVWLISKTMLASANAYEMWGYPTEVKNWDAALNQLANETDDPRPRGLYMMRSAYNAAMRGDFVAGIDYAEECLRTSISPIDLAYGNLAMAFNQVMLGQLEESTQALEHLRTDMENKGMVIVNFLAIEVPYSFLLLLKGELNQAITHLEQQAKRFQSLGQPNAQTYGHLYLGQIYVILATSKDRPTWDLIKRNWKFLLTKAPFAERHALNHLKLALDGCHELECPAGQIMCLFHMFTLHQSKERHSDAEACRDQATEIAKSNDAEQMLTAFQSERE